MKKFVLMIFGISIIGLAAGCGAQGNTHVSGGQNSVESVLQAAAEAMTETAAEESTAEITEETTLAEETAAETVTEAVTEAAEAQTAAQPVQTVPETPEAPAVTADMIDLSEMSANMVYSEVFAMMTEPEEYRGKTIKMTGICNRYTDINTGADYYACIVQDATACCAQGIEFCLPEGEAYPEYGSKITVTGTFDSYFEGENEYFVLMDAKINN